MATFVQAKCVDSVDNDEYSVERLDSGFIKCRGRLAKTGIRLFRQADGTIRRDLRLPEEVFSAASLKSYQLAPLTLEHPPAGYLSPEDVGQFQVGNIGDNIVVNGQYVESNILITSREAIDAFDSGEKRELSMGYSMSLEMSPGFYEGQPFDAIQRNIVINHCALTEKARLGPDCRVLGVDSAVNDNLISKGIDNMEEIEKVEEPKEEPKSADSSEELKASIKELEGHLKEAQACIEELKSKLEKAEGAKEQAEKTANDSLLAIRPEAINKLVKERLTLIQKASRLAPKLACDALSPEEIRVQALVAFDPSYKSRVKGRSNDFIEGVFETAIPTETALAIDAEISIDSFSTNEDVENPYTALMKRIKG